ncbi:TPA: DsbA family protein [Escherichia albertii]|nr:DsbA family protein [Escherichia coli]
MFDAAIKNEPIKNEDDIKAVFIQSGIDVNEFDSAKNIFMVKTLRQEKAAEQFGITGTPAFYVNGRHHIKNNGMNDSSVEGYGKEVSDLVYQLIIKNP